MEESGSIKVYKQVDKIDQSLYFGISRMEDIHDKHKGQPDVPHRHDYYTILLVKKAKGKHLVDFQEYDLKGNQVFFIAPGQVHQILEEERSEGFSMVFSLQFLVANNLSMTFVEELNLFNDYGYYPPLPVSDQESEKLAGFCEEMMLLTQNDTKHGAQAIAAYLNLFFIQCSNVCTLNPYEHQENDASRSLFKKFKQLLNERHQHWHATSQYAEELRVSPDHLNRVIKTLVGRTAKEMIQNRIVLAAKRLLYFTDLSSKEIGYELGFSEPANFSAFFKNCTGASPSQFKKLA